MSDDPLAFGSVFGELSLEEQLSPRLFRARRIRDGRELAVYVIPSETPAQAAELLARAEAVSGIQHPAIARVEAYGQLEDGRCYIASELVRGPSLSEWLNAFDTPTLPQVVELVQGLCSALQAALARGLVHEALHAGAIRVLRSRASLTLKLTDLAVPAAFSETVDAKALRFMAPEQLAAAPDFRPNAATNVYACGAVLYLLALAEVPYVGDDLESLLAAQAQDRFKPPISLKPRFPTDLNAVVLRALARDPEQRYASVAELSDALAACSGSVVLYAQSLGPQVATPSLASPSSARVSDPGVTPIGLLSSSPPLTEPLSSLPPHALDRDTDISSLREHYDLAAPSSTAAARPKPSSQRWLAAPAIAGACLIAFLVVRGLLAPDAEKAPVKQGSLASQTRTREEQPAPAPGLPLTAKVQIHEVQVHGGALPTALVKRAVIRLRSHFKHCYEQSARAAGHNSFDELTVDVQIDAQGHAHSPTVRGGKLPQLESCVAEGASKLISEGSPDRSELVASWKLIFTP